MTCASCTHLAKFQAPIERGSLTYIGACAEPHRSSVGGTVMVCGHYGTHCRDFADANAERESQAIRSACEHEA